MNRKVSWSKTKVIKNKSKRPSNYRQESRNNKIKKTNETKNKREEKGIRILPSNPVTKL